MKTKTFLTTYSYYNFSDFAINFKIFLNNSLYIIEHHFFKFLSLIILNSYKAIQSVFADNL